MIQTYERKTAHAETKSQIIATTAGYWLIGVWFAWMSASLFADRLLANPPDGDFLSHVEDFPKVWFEPWVRGFGLDFLNCCQGSRYWLAG
jgi:hypothetical protein